MGIPFAKPEEYCSAAVSLKIKAEFFYPVFDLRQGEPVFLHMKKQIGAFREAGEFLLDK
jgi:hypothetical protein